jgi:23S rRNA (uracil1939-C5)-methyltransferase
VKVFCAHAGVCGGCDLLHLSYAEQLGQKKSALAARLAATKIVPEFAPLFPEDQNPGGFRQKVAFVFGTDARGRLVMGHYARGSQMVVPVVDCPVHSARGNRIAFALRDQLIRAGVEAAGASRRGVLRHLLIRTSQDERQAVAMLVVTENDKVLRRPVRALMDSADRPDGFFINIHAGPGPFMVGPTTIRIAGQRHVREMINGISYLVSPTAFFQTNALAAATLQRLVLSRIDGGRVLDLYCGSGLFTIALARQCTRVVGIEDNLQAVKDAEANARINRIEEGRLRFLRARVEDGLSRVAKDRWDSVVLDPPRQGCPPTVIEAVFEHIKPARVVYVSCNPDALAAELPAILRAGYRIDDVRAVDMFPHTEHIEAVVQLSRKVPAA